jgi:hypothetical protein
MDVTPETVRRQYEFVSDRDDLIVRLINDLRERFGEEFETTVDPVAVDQYQAAVDTVFADGPRAVNVATYVALLRDLDVAADYPGFVVDEYLGRHLAAAIAGPEPFGLLGQAAFHYADVGYHREDETAGMDDLDAALATGFQTRLPGWDWTDEPSPFAVDPE